VKNEKNNENSGDCDSCEKKADAIATKRNRSEITGAFSIIVIVIVPLIAPLGVTIWGFVSVVLGVIAIVTGIRLIKESRKFEYGIALGIVGIALSVYVTYKICSLPWS